MRLLKWVILALILTGVGMGAQQALAKPYEEPDFQLIKQQGKLEIRQYPPHLVAEVTATGNREEAANAGFRQLADFIFGNNVQADKVPMTVPVTQAPASTTEKIGMTVPVVQQPTTSESIPMTVPVQTTRQQDPDSATAGQQKWVIRFFMPKRYTAETLPKPVNPNIRIAMSEPIQVAALRFNGRSTESNLRRHEVALHQELAANGLTPDGETSYAFYNSPFTLPILRRNEVLIPVKAQQ